jgi:hypothetical protein
VVARSPAADDASSDRGFETMDASLASRTLDAFRPPIRRVPAPSRAAR